MRPAQLQSGKSAAGFTSLQREEMEGYRNVAQMLAAARSGNHAEASKIYQQLPEDTKKTKMVFGARLLATEREEFFEAVEAMLLEYPNSPAVALSLFDFGIQHKDLPTLTRASELLEKWTAGDPYIDLNVASIMSKLGKAEEASELSKKIDLKKFDFINPIFLKYSIALEVKDNVTLLECFRSLRDDYDQNIKEILKSDACKEFCESLEYVDLKND